VAKKKKTSSRSRVAKKKATKKKKTSSRSRVAKKKTASRSSTPKKKAATKARVAKKSSSRAPATAQSMAKQQREISVSEFFTKNRHLLGFDSPTKALLTTIKEAVDNSLDACEEAEILPDLVVEIVAISENRYRVIVEDNGPGIVKDQIPKIFGKLLYGSKFHRLRQSRGQQGIGISAAGMYGQLTTGKPIVIESRAGKRKKPHHYTLVIDTQKNQPVVKKDREIEWEKKGQGTRVEIELEGTYKRGKHGVEAYLRQTVLANPHVSILYKGPGEKPVDIQRASKVLPEEALEIKPHPYGVEVGMLLRMLKDTKSRQLKGFFQAEFSRVGPKSATSIIEASGLSTTTSPRRVSSERAEALIAAIRETKIPAPPTNCLSPIGEERIKASLKQQMEADWYTSVTRSPSVYRGNPFQVEVGLAYGGELSGDDLATLYRYANRVPLQYQQGACAAFKAVLATNWRSYGLQQSRGALPTGPLVIMVHVASVWVPFTSESKEAVASYDEIIKELKLAFQQAGRQLGQYIKRGKRIADAERKRKYIEKYIPHIGIALKDILDLTDRQEKKVVNTLTDTLERSRKM
jgi:DNA topoisomerase-6 subunit B